MIFKHLQHKRPLDRIYQLGVHCRWEQYQWTPKWIYTNPLRDIYRDTYIYQIYLHMEKCQGPKRCREWWISTPCATTILTCVTRLVDTSRNSKCNICIKLAIREISWNCTQNWIVQLKSKNIWYLKKDRVSCSKILFGQILPPPTKAGTWKKGKRIRWRSCSTMQ